MSHSIGVIMNGVTGRMGANQHLLRSIIAIREQGGLLLDDGERLLPVPILVGRSKLKLEALGGRFGLRWSTDLDAELDRPENEIYFDAQITSERATAVRKAISAKKHIYCEKPTADNLADALDIYSLAHRAQVIHGVVQDKLWLPGIVKLRRLIDDGFFGQVLSVRGEFGYWVFTGGDCDTPQRPSWNYRKEEGGGIILDMLSHWRYLLDNLFGRVLSVSCMGATHIGRRWDEAGMPYVCTADDAAYATFELEGGIVAQFNSSWCVRVRRDDLLTIQVDGTDGSAVADLRKCRIQPASGTPRPVWNPDVPSAIDYQDGWAEFEPEAPTENAFKAEWELYLRSVASGSPFRWDLREGARGVQLAELAMESWRSRQWMPIPELPEP